MNNKKGFTLVELLAVIVILAVLALIITPVITNIITGAKKSSFKSSAYGLAEAVKNCCAGSLLKNNVESTDSVKFTLNNGELVSSNGDKLEVKGKMPVGDSWVTITNNCGVSLKVTDGNYFASKEVDEMDVTITEQEDDALTRDELTTLVNNLSNKIDTLTSDNETLKSEISSLKEKDISIDNINSIQTSKIDAGSVYSTDEEKIGTWINGKPIYRRTFTNLIIPNVSTLTATYYDTGIDNLGTITNIYGGMRSNDGTAFYELPYSDSGGYIYLLANSSNHSIGIINSTCSWRDYYKLEITVEYTKTTD